MATYYVRTDGSDSNTGLANDAAHAWLTVQKALNTVANGDIAYVVGTGVYSIGTGLTAAAGAGSVTNTAKTRIIGCTATPGDGGKAILRATAGIDLLTLTGAGWSFESLDFDGNNVVGCRGVYDSPGALYNAILDCKIRNFKSNGLQLYSSFFSALRCEVTGCSGTQAVLFGGNTSAAIFDSWIHDNSCTGVGQDGNSNPILINCIVSNNTGGSSDGIGSAQGTLIRNCVIHANGRHGILLGGNFIATPLSIQNNIITSNGGYGIKFNSAPVTTVSQQIDYNAYYNNTSGPVNNLNQSAHDVLLTADPYTNAAGNDFSLNSTAGGGAACRAAGFPGLFPGGITRGYLDIGAAQHLEEVFPTEAQIAAATWAYPRRTLTG